MSFPLKAIIKIFFNKDLLWQWKIICNIKTLKQLPSVQTLLWPGFPLITSLATTRTVYKPLCILHHIAFFTAILYNYRAVGTYSHRLSFILYRYASSPLFKEDGFFFIRHSKRYVATAFAWQDKLNSLEGRLHWLAVLPEYHRQGLGRALALRVLLYHKDHGKESVSLITEVYRHSALKLYKDIGFVCSAKETWQSHWHKLPLHWQRRFYALPPACTREGKWDAGACLQDWL